MSRLYAGIGDCPDCERRVLFAVDANGDLVACDEGKDGPVAVRWDVTNTPRIRSVSPDYQTGPNEHRFRLHACPCAPLAPVIPLTRQPPLIASVQYAKAR